MPFIFEAIEPQTFFKNLLTIYENATTYQPVCNMDGIEPTVLPETKRKLVDAGVKLMRAHGFNATTVDEICAAAGVTKGGFFHYFKSKDDIVKSAAVRFHECYAKAYQDAPFRMLADLLDRGFGHLNFAKESDGSDKRLTKGCLISLSSI